MLNPYSPPDSEPKGEDAPRKPFRIGWLIVPTVLLMMYGSIMLPDFTGRSVGDPDGRSRGAAAAGGAIGLALGSIGYFLAGHKPN
ncbi:hypothetical protein [Planctomycetes bacterium K23_9]|uniref:hypothetical protein n=1 Tax=Stieleria marina TaxID=1930275 RepID=UPI0011A7C185